MLTRHRQVSTGWHGESAPPHGKPDDTRRDPMLRAIRIGAGLVVALLVIALLTRDVGSLVLRVTWFIPTIDAFLVLVSACITLLAVGRFRVLHDPSSFWIGAGFSAFTVGLVAHLLTFPGLLPDGTAIIAGAVPSSAALSIFASAQTIALTLLLSAIASRPRRQTRPAVVALGFAACVLTSAAVHVLIFTVTPHLLPQVTPEGRLTPGPYALLVVISLTSAAGVLLSTRRYRRTHDLLAGYVALCQLATFYFASVILVGDVVRYGVWWYFEFIGWTAGLLIVLFGLLSGYVQLFRREQERTRLRQISEDRYRSLVQASSQAVWVAMPSGEVLEGTESWSAFTGQTFDEIRGWGWLNAIHPDDRDRAARTWREALAARSEYHIEYRLRDAGGEYRETIVRAVPIFNEDGSVREWVGMNTDVTEQRRAERSLQDSERKFRATFEQAAIGMGRVSFTDARWIDVNETFCEMLGYTRAEMLNTPWPQITHAEDVARDLIPFQRMAAGELDSYSVEKRFIHKHGHHVWARMTLSLVRDGAGNPEYEIAIIEDVTERKHAEEALRASEERFRSVIEGMSEGLMLFDAEGNLTYQNSASLRIHGFGETADSRIGREALPTTWEAWDYATGQPITFNEWPVSRVFRHERFQDQVLRVRRVETGQEFYGSYNGSPIYDAAGRLALGFITIRDITHEIDAQTALAARERRLRTIYDSDMIGIMYWNLDGRITDANDKALEILRLERDALRNARWDAMTPGEYRAADERAVQELRTTGIETPYEKEFIGGDGTRVPVIVGAAMLDDARTEGVAFVLDISERKRVERELEAAHESARRAKEAAEQATRAKDQFLAVLSHELRTPLTPVLAAIDMLHDSPRPDSADRELLEMIRRNVEMEARLIDDLLDVTRIVRGKVELSRQPIRLRQVIDRAIEVCRVDIEQRALEFSASIDECGEHLVNADPARLQQVFWNLLKNAVKFTPPGGRLQVRCNRVDDAIITDVVDSGEGIEPHVLPFIFNAFEQGGAHITRQFGGLGLGLTITRGVVELHGGSIEAHSAGPGKGATFRVRLPICAGCREEQVAPGSTSRPAPVPRREALSILLVEDHADTARVMRQLLAARGHQVDVAHELATALDCLEAREYDLLLSDLGLPDGSGIDLIRKLRAGGSTLPAIALSGYGQEEDVRRSKDAGFMAHLTKPADLQLLLRTITTVAAQARA